MPIYEYYCPGNNKLYSFLARSSAVRDQVPTCPDDPALPLQKHVSTFAIIGKAREESADDPFASLDDGKMESLMTEMESEMAGLDDDNPNPRQMGHFMRRLTDLMGNKTPPELREIVRRLEGGEDPEKLEAEFSALEAEAGDSLFGQVRSIMHAAKRPVRDPKLYDLADYLPRS
ncbi:MAG TPA: cytochrome C [Prosthecobacter sp.]|nr:cytochrome C [Prosthecobacter sp.]